MRFKKLVGLLLSVCMLTTLSIPSNAASTQERLANVRQEKENTESNLAAAEERIANLESLKGDLEAYLTELNAQYTELSEGLADLADQSQKKETELTKVKAELKEAKRQEAEQYAAMKLRIAYMYENSDTSYLAALLSAKSFADFLNRAENIMMISKYDRDMLEKYEETKEEVALKMNQVEEEQKAIEELKAEIAVKREEIQQLEDSTQDEIISYQIRIDSEQLEANSLLALVNSQSEELNSLVAQVEAEQAAAAKAEAEAKARAEAEAKAVAEAEAAAKAEASEAQDSSDEAGVSAADESDNTYEEEVTPNDSQTSVQETVSSGNGTYLGNFKLTAYCNCAQCCGTVGNYTASGTWPTPGRTVAMAGVPFGTLLSINGNIYTVEDLGTPYGHVDIYCSSHAEALAFGLQYADVYRLN